MFLSSWAQAALSSTTLGSQRLAVATRILAATLLVAPMTIARAQLTTGTFGRIPLWADSALRRAGLDQQFALASTLNPYFAVGDFDRDGLDDFAVEVKDSGGLRCGIAIVHRIDRSVHFVGAGHPLGNGHDELACGSWGVQLPSTASHAGSRLPLLYVADHGTLEAWLVWDGRIYVWVRAD
jgi:hypothetical protein